MLKYLPLLMQLQLLKEFFATKNANAFSRHRMSCIYGDSELLIEIKYD